MLNGSYISLVIGSRALKYEINLSKFCEYCILLATEVVPKIFPNLNVVAYLVVPAVWGSCLPRLAILFLYVNA